MQAHAGEWHILPTVHATVLPELVKVNATCNMRHKAGCCMIKLTLPNCSGVSTVAGARIRVMLKPRGAPVFRQTSQNSPAALGLTGVTQVLVMTWQCASPVLVLRTQPPSFTAYTWPAAPATLYRGWQLQKLTDLAAHTPRGFRRV